MENINFKNRKVLELIERVKNKDIEAFVQLNMLDSVQEYYSYVIKDGYVCIEKPEFGIVLELKAIYEYDPDFYKEVLGLTEEDFNNDNEKISEIDASDCERYFKQINQIYDTLISVKSSFERFVKEQKCEEKGTIKSLECKIEELRKINEFRSKECERLEKERTELKNNSVGNEEIERLKRLAYYDGKTKVKNYNAFEEKTNSLEYGFPIAEISICEQKKINEKYGFSLGDERIRQVVGEIAKKYSPNNIYRVFGDVFFVIPENSDEKELFENVSKIKDALKHLDIKVATGVQAFYGTDTFDKLDVDIKKAKTYEATSLWATLNTESNENAEDFEVGEEDDGFIEEDSLALLNQYK